MKFEEHAAKPLLAAAGIAIPRSQLCRSVAEAREAAAAIGPCMVKAQVPAGQRRRAGGVLAACDPEAAGEAAARILVMSLGGYPVERLLVEARMPVAQELYVAILNDQCSKAPLLLFGARGGMAIEELAARHPEQMAHLPIDIRDGLDDELLAHIMIHLGLARLKEPLVELCLRLYDVYRVTDAELIEINPLALTTDGRLVALDCKLIVDDAALPRRAALAAQGVPERLTELEAAARALGLTYVELDGTVGVLGTGAGLTLTTMDAICHHGGRPANFLEIGGLAYTLGRPAVEIVLAHPKVRSLVVHFCGAFARTDVMVAGVLDAWRVLQPAIPAFFSIHGTGEEAAIAMIEDQLGRPPFELMDDAVRAAVEAAA